ncbi:MAG: HD domain-containing protein [Thaumarchaeota archaeon]|nr:HD domain-containing protein [Candidatus Calditenuaceae archaeon]MDW8186443.1 HD domain-containing protein [Nitrososphaerota archaeon]
MDSWLLELHSAASALKSLERKGWRLRGVRDPESVADHSLALAVLSCALAAARGLDPGKAALIAVLHDLPEAFTGDLMPGEKASLGEERLSVIEDTALARILDRAPDAVRNLLTEAVSEYRMGVSPEGRLVRDLDKLEMVLQAVEYIDELGTEGVKEFAESALKNVKDQEISTLIGDLLRGLRSD